MNILVTGSDGYIAKGVIERLLAEGHRVHAIGLKASGIKGERFSETIGDVFSYEFSAAAVPDVLLHLAWRDGFAHNSMAHLDDLPKHYKLIESAVSSGVGRIAVMGSMHEVGYHEGAVNEDTPCNPTTPYGVSKNALRQLTEELCRKSGAKMLWLRGFYLVSNDGRGCSIFAKLVQAEREGKSEFPFTSGKCKYDFLPYDVFCAQVVAAILQDRVDGIVNICSGKPIALGDYIEDFIAKNKFSIRLAYGKYPDRPYDSPAIWGDASKINEIMKMASAEC